MHATLCIVALRRVVGDSALWPRLSALNPPQTAVLKLMIKKDDAATAASTSTASQANLTLRVPTMGATPLVASFA